MNTNNGSRFARDGRAKLINAKLQAVQGLLGKTLGLLSVRQSRSLSVASAEKDYQKEILERQQKEIESQTDEISK